MGEGLSTYTATSGLVSRICTVYGAGDGSTTFNLPDLRGEFLRGLDSGRGVDADRALGSAQGEEYKSHTHTGSSSNTGSHTHTGSVTVDSNGAHTHTVSGTAASAGDHTHTLRNYLSEIIVSTGIDSIVPFLL